MIKFKKAICAILLVFSIVCVLSGCAKLPMDEIEVRVVTAEKTYLRDENKTELFFVFDVLNGKNRSIKTMEVDVAVQLRDGSVKNHTLIYDEEISYRGSYPAIMKCTVDGRVDSIDILDYRFEILDYWGSFGSHIIITFVFYIVMAVVMVYLAMAEMDALVSIIAGALVLFCIIYVIFSPLAASIYVIIGTVIAFLPFIISKVSDYY